MESKFRKFCINTMLVFGCLIMFIILAILCDKYDSTHHNAKIAGYEMEAAQYKAQTESIKMQTAQIHLDAENERLKAFVKAFSNGTYPKGEIENE